MKVGDIVRQNSKLVQFRGRKPALSKSRLGVIISITDQQVQLPAVHAEWGPWLGRSVTVLWTNGRLTQNMAENALDVIINE